MASKYSHHILDSWLNPKIVANFDEVDKYKGIADQIDINTGLSNFGRQQQEKIFSGNIGSTLLAGAARTQGARDIQGLKASQRLGAGALARSGGGPSGAGMTFLYDRMLKNETGRVNDRTADQIVGNLGSYIDKTAGWADQANQDRFKKLQAGGAYQNMFSNAVRMRQSNQTFEKKKSLWDKIKEGVGLAGDLFGLATGIGSLGGIFGGNVAGDGVSNVGKPPVGGDGGYG